MASKALTKFNVDWSKIMAGASEKELPKLNRLKAQCATTGIKVTSLPESLPQIDWNYYKQHASNPKIVEDIQKNYVTIKVEAPKVPANRLQDLQLAQHQDEERFKRYCEVANDFVRAIEVVKTKFENMIPVKDMTMEDWSLTFPHWTTSIEHPSIYPHLGRTAGLTREEAAAFDIPDPVPFATKTAWKDWETKYKKWYN